jgi:hypothetical protein
VSGIFVPARMPVTNPVTGFSKTVIFRLRKRFACRALDP